MTLENYSEPEGVGLCRNCGKEFGDHWPCGQHEEDSSLDGRKHCGTFFCITVYDQRRESEFEERDADWYAEREASRRER